MPCRLLCELSSVPFRRSIDCRDRDDVTPSRLSFNLHYFLPSMAVSFPSTVDYVPSQVYLPILKHADDGKSCEVAHRCFGTATQSLYLPSPLVCRVQWTRQPILEGRQLAWSRRTVCRSGKLYRNMRTS